MRPLTQEQIVEGQKIASELAFIKSRLGKIGLYKSMHAIDKATGPLGFELAEHIEALTHAGANDQARRDAAFGR